MAILRSTIFPILHHLHRFLIFIFGVACAGLYLTVYLRTILSFSSSQLPLRVVLGVKPWIFWMPNYRSIPAFSSVFQSCKERLCERTELYMRHQEVAHNIPLLIRTFGSRFTSKSLENKTNYLSNRDIKNLRHVLLYRWLLI